MTPPTDSPANAQSLAAAADRPLRATAARGGRAIRRLRAWSGLVVAAFVVTHLANHALGIASIEVMDAARPYLTGLWWHPLMALALYGSLAVHFVLALYSLYRRHSLRMPLAEALQLGAGLLIPLLLASHAISTRGANAIAGLDPTYAHVMLVLWNDGWLTVKQALLLMLVWTHLVVGMHLWLRVLPRAGPIYERCLPALTAFAVLVPVLALLGYARGGAEILEIADNQVERAAIVSHWSNADPAKLQLVRSLAGGAPYVFGLVIASVFAARRLRKRAAARRSEFRVSHPVGDVPIRIGQTVLEALQSAGIPHASVCGGRARCTTCRIRVGPGRDQLHAPGSEEAAALARIVAADNVRLACQLRPQHNLDVTPLLPTGDEALQRARRGGVAGREQRVVTMFVDMRDSTTLAEGRLPYDVVFILNEFFAEMSAALEQSNGHYAQFSGDGLMALFGLQGGIDDACRDALRCARRMGVRLDVLNARLAGELHEPIRIGIGIHVGDAIVGTMGPPDSPNFSAIGDNVNIAARLESMCKTLGASVVVSLETVRLAGAAVGEWPVHHAEVRGRESVIEVYAIKGSNELELQ